MLFYKTTLFAALAFTFATQIQGRTLRDGLSAPACHGSQCKRADVVARAPLDLPILPKVEPDPVPAAPVVAPAAPEAAPKVNANGDPFAQPPPAAEPASPPQQEAAPAPDSAQPPAPDTNKDPAPQAAPPTQDDLTPLVVPDNAEDALLAPDDTTPAEDADLQSKDSDEFATVCARAPGDGGCEAQSGSNRPSYWEPQSDEQIELYAMSLDQQKQMWDDMQIGGKKVQALLDKYVGAGKSRLADLPEGQQPHPIHEGYDSEIVNEARIDGQLTQVSDALKAAGVTSVHSANDNFARISVSSLAKTGGPALEIGANRFTGTIVAEKMSTALDGAPVPAKLRMSELIWQSWSDYAFRPKSGVLPATDSDRLLNIEIHNIVQQDTLNIMSLAHIAYPEKVTNLRDLNQPTTGHGKWVPGDDGHTALLNSPLIKVFANMVADHNPEMAAPHFSEIHTQPADFGAPPGRLATIVLVLGSHA